MPGRLSQYSLKSASSVSASYANKSTQADGATVASFATTASYAITASYALNGGGGSINTSSLLTITSFNNWTGSSTSQFLGTASNALSSSYSLSSSFARSASYSLTSSYAISSSYALNGGVTKLIAGSNITLSPTDGLGQVTINSTGGGGGSGSNTVSTFSNLSTWVFSHGLGNQYVVVQTLDSNYNQIIPKSITLTDSNTATITFPTSESGYAIATIGGTGVSSSFAVTASYALSASYSINSLTSSYIALAQTASYVLIAQTASYVVLAQTASFITTSQTASYVLNAISSSRSTTASFALTSSFVNTLNQNVIITGSVAIGTGSIGNGENNLLLGPAPAGGTGEGGQIALLAVGGTYTSSSFLDNYQNQFRILSGPGATSNVGVLSIDLQTRHANFQGAVTASGFNGLPNDYLYVTRNTDQTVGSNWANTDIIFNNTVVSKGISYNTGTGLASLTAGKVYRITARLAWQAAATYLFQYSCYNSSNIILGPTVEIVQSTNGTNNISDGTLDFIYAPGSNVDIKIRTTANTTALSGEKIRGDLNTQLIIQQIA